MSSGTLISILVAVIGCILAIFFYMNDSLDRRIGRAVNNPDFLKKVADVSRLPFLLFDENGTFQTESGGATTFIDKIEPFKEENRFSGFIIYPKDEYILSYKIILKEWLWKNGIWKRWKKN